MTALPVCAMCSRCRIMLKSGAPFDPNQALFGTDDGLNHLNRSFVIDASKPIKKLSELRQLFRKLQSSGAALSQNETYPLSIKVREHAAWPMFDHLGEHNWYTQRCAQLQLILAIRVRRYRIECVNQCHRDSRPRRSQASETYNWRKTVKSYK